uniref:RNA-binding motif protein, X-linked 2 n=1 Tax=Lygus hesperus TaxID=30085 RepID=A0A146KQS9_LYGHE
MNTIQEIQRLNRRELELAIPESASWHSAYKDSAYIFVGNLHTDLTEGDVIVAFSQFGEIVDMYLQRDRETGKSRGFAFIAYEDQRSTVLAVDNMNGARLVGRTVRVDHAARYRKPSRVRQVDCGMKVPFQVEHYDDGNRDEDEDVYEYRRRLIWDYESYV